MPFFLGNIILLKEKGGLRESIPRQIDKNSRVPGGEKGSGALEMEIGHLELSRSRKGQLFFSSTFLSFSHLHNSV